LGKSGEARPRFQIFEKAVSMAAATKGLKILAGSGVDSDPFPHGIQALEFEWLVKRVSMTPAAAIQAGTMTNAQMMGWQDRMRSAQELVDIPTAIVPG